MPCVVSQDGDIWTIDESHPAYPMIARVPALLPSFACLAGTHLKKLLGGWPFNIVASDNCKCASRARYMDAMGCGWCEQNVEEIVGYLREEAVARGLPFLDAAARMLVKRAIHNARKEEARHAAEQGSPLHSER